MAKIEFPKPLKELLDDSPLQAPIRRFADQVGVILADNKLPFFPNYTDHGVDHINRVLASEVDLVPAHVWGTKDAAPLLCDVDAAILIGATLLHDIGMHLRPTGFRELVAKESRFKPLDWFDDDHDGHTADIPWHELWENFAREARRFGERQLGAVIGEAPARAWKFDGLPDDVSQERENDRLIVGEFIRRHHARLAHEIAIYGFPGILVGDGDGQFPAIGKAGHALSRLADLIGLAARSHGMSLRVCQAYLEESPFHRGVLKPMGSAVLYPMALLRVADYLQIDQQRAPAVLLQLRNPQSPVSVREWARHLAVINIGPAKNPRSRMVTVSTDLSLSLFLQLQELLRNVQGEIDHSTAVLDEAYGTYAGLDKLGLAIRRVDSNLEHSSYQKRLPYVPRRTGFSADPNLLTLLVEPLYGEHPNVGVRELIQNATDAARELHVWCKARDKFVDALDLPEQATDVLVEFLKHPDGHWLLRVRDKGIGMEVDTVDRYFLRAGATFRASPEWTKEFLDENGHPRVNRAGRFGVGAFAIFLLGESFRMWTRHVSADTGSGYSIECNSNSQLVEIKRISDLPVGTTIEIELSDAAVKSLHLEADDSEYHSLDFKTIDILTSHSIEIRSALTDWFCWNWPTVTRQVVIGDIVEVLHQEYQLPIHATELPPEWSIIHPTGFDAVYWTFKGAPSLSCNGLVVANPHFQSPGIHWTAERMNLHTPCIAVLDGAANLPLTVQRYELAQYSVPFSEDLMRDVMLSVIAYLLVCGPPAHREALSLSRRHPLVGRWRENPLEWPDLRWCVTQTEIFPAEPGLFPLLRKNLCRAYGATFGNMPEKHLSTLPYQQLVAGYSGAVIPSFFQVRHGGESREQLMADSLRAFGRLLEEKASAVGHDITSSRILISCPADVAVPLDVWSEVASPNAGRRWWGSTKDCKEAPASLGSMIEPIDAWLGTNESPVFVAELEIRPTTATPTSPMAAVWAECLGDRAVPFDCVARNNLIAHALTHPELRRHIGAWQQMKDTNSKWTNIGDDWREWP